LDAGEASGLLALLASAAGQIGQTGPESLIAPYV
jgi:hypothetical protein